MRIMYIAPRFHTNQAAVVKGWQEHKDEVMFISYYRALIEDYSCLQPVVLGFSPLYCLFDWFYVNIWKKKDLNAITFKINHGFPPVFKLMRTIQQWKPDVVIVRDRTFYTIASYLIAKKSKCHCILYNQSPLWDEPAKTDWKHRAVRRLTPSYRMTPVMGREGKGREISRNSFFVPFIAEPQQDPMKKQYFVNHCIHVLCIGKFEPRKHHMMLMDVLQEISEETKQDIQLTVIGEATTRHQTAFLEEVKTHIHENSMEAFVTIRKNIPREEMDLFYRETDVCVIPSTREPASISQLEAMSYSIPVICSDENGSACYIKEGKSGFLFHDCDKEDLKRKLRLLTEDRERIKTMGACAYREIVRNYSFLNYHKAIKDILEQMNNDYK